MPSNTVVPGGARLGWGRNALDGQHRATEVIFFFFFFPPENVITGHVCQINQKQLKYHICLTISVLGGSASNNRLQEKILAQLTL